MSIEKLKRVMWRLKETSKNPTRASVTELKRAIMIECGTCPTTYNNNKRALLELGWLARRKRRFLITGKHETEEF